MVSLTESVEAKPFAQKPEEAKEDEEKIEEEEGSEDGQAGKSEGIDEDDVKGADAGVLNKPEKKGSQKLESSPVTPSSSSRPTREKKTVDRFYAISTPISSAPKSFSIEKGRGMQLKDIPNVAYKLSKRKPDENLQALHSILYGKKTKTRNLKKNIGQFSGYTWAEDEHDKQRTRLQDRFDKCVKDKLVDFCDVLNLPVNKTTMKKEELSVRLLEFLESPHITTDMLLAEKEKKRKNRRSKATKAKLPTDKTAEKPAKKQKGQKGRKRKQLSEENEESDSSKNDSHEDDEDANEESDNKDADSENDKDQEDSEESKEDHNEKISANKDSGTPSKAKSSKISEKTTIKSRSSALEKGADPSTNPEVKTARKRRKTEKSSGEKKNAPTIEKVSKRKLSSKPSLTETSENGEVKPEPSKDEIYAAAANILKGANFDTVTIADITLQLGAHFGVDFKPRKAEVKAIITEAINDMSEDEDDGGDGENEDLA